jgi:predicted nucleic acid-binding protein
MLREENSPSTGQSFVLDSYALLAFLGGETGADAVEQLLEKAKKGEVILHMCVVNLGEVLYIAERERGLNEAHKVLAFVEDLPVNIVDVDRNLALAAAHIKAHTPIAYADCFAAALALAKDAELVTGDTEFRKLEPACVRIRWMDKRQ